MPKSVVEIISNENRGISVKIPESSSAPIWQTPEWNAFLSRSGWAKKGFFAYSGEWENPTARAFLELRSVWFGQYGLFCVWGPTVSDADSAPNLSATLRELALETGALFVQYEPLADVGLPGFSNGEYRHFLEKRTLLLDLRLSEEELLSQMKEKGRYNVKLATKRGVRIRMSEGSEKDVRSFFGLLSETLDRDGFSGNSFAYYEELVRTLTDARIGGLFVAEKDGEPVAAAISTFVGGTATYYYGASTSDNEKRRDMPAYALQWEMMLEGKRRGCETYDFLGIAPEGVENHPLAGVTDFKLKFGGTPAVWPESRIMIVKPFAYRALSILRRLKKAFGK